MTNMNDIKTYVNAFPGHIAYWYKRKSDCKCRNSWVYAAFQRALKHQVIRAEKMKNTTIYFINSID